MSRGSKVTTYTIGHAAKAAGITTPAARLYEARGLVEPAERTPAG
ncbi:MAG: MerR family DNA-binding transcriptional regulator [Acidimicrobiia bacterium]|nr:MerR family DNA-binding transcriptional regulator [Acidimicrobiia bacterium]